MKSPGNAGVSANCSFCSAVLDPHSQKIKHTAPLNDGPARNAGGRRTYTHDEVDDLVLERDGQIENLKDPRQGAQDGGEGRRSCMTDDALTLGGRVGGC
jgi:hypothetical protein